MATGKGKKDKRRKSKGTRKGKEKEIEGKMQDDSWPMRRRGKENERKRRLGMRRGKGIGK
jgi:hypothetical protein